MSARLHLVIRTPHEIVLEGDVNAARVPTATGQVGLRPRREPLLLVVEAGLVIVRTGDGGVRFAATAGGLLEGTREQTVLYTPFAVAGDADAEVLAALDRALAVPDGELAARRRLTELEQRIVKELRQERRSGPARGEVPRAHEAAP